MANPSVAHPGTDSRREYTARAERALALYEERGHLIRALGADRYEVPSCSMDGRRYIVRYGGEVERCSCPDRHVPCKHLIAAALAGPTVRRRSGVKVRTISAAGDPFKFWLRPAGRSQRRGCSLCFGGYVTITVEEDGQERHEAVPCRRCAS